MHLTNNLETNQSRAEIAIATKKKKKKTSGQVSFFLAEPYGAMCYVKYKARGVMLLRNDRTAVLGTCLAPLL